MAIYRYSIFMENKFSFECYELVNFLDFPEKAQHSEAHNSLR
jgi:hypothetical protein